MAFQKEASVYLQVRRLGLENMGIIITDPFDYMQVVPYVNGFINTVEDQYFKASITKSIKSYDYSNTNIDCDGQVIKIYYASTSGLLAGSQQFTGLEQNLGCYSPGTAPILPNKFQMIFRPYSEQNADGNYVVYNYMKRAPYPIVATVPNAPGYDGISFTPDNPIDPITNPTSTTTGYYIFRMYPEVEIQIKP